MEIDIDLQGIANACLDYTRKCILADPANQSQAHGFVVHNDGSYQYVTGPSDPEGMHKASLILGILASRGDCLAIMMSASFTGINMGMVLKDRGSEIDIKDKKAIIAKFEEIMEEEYNGDPTRLPEKYQSRSLVLLGKGPGLPPFCLVQIYSQEVAGGFKFEKPGTSEDFSDHVLPDWWLNADRWKSLPLEQLLADPRITTQL